MSSTETSSVVSLGDVVEKRRQSISEIEAWALLCQTVQALQDLFLNGGEEEKVNVECTLAALQLTSKGRVILGQRPHPLPYPQLSDTHLEKMWIYSLGVTVRGIVNWTEASVGLKTILSRMLSPDLQTRASLMDLLDVISAYCRGKKHSKPLSHVIMDLYAQTSRNVTPENHSTPLTTRRFAISHQKQTRISPDLYSHPLNGAKYCGPTTLIGPEFIVRSSEPIGIVTLKDAETPPKRKVLVILLNGHKLEINCNPSAVTFGDIFQVVSKRDNLEHGVTLGVACLVSDDFVFPPPELKVAKLAPANWSKGRCHPPPPAFTVYLRFRLYLPTLRGTRSWKWKHHLYLQLRRSLLERQLRAQKHQLIALSGLALQAEFGDYSPGKDGNYFLTEHYVPDGEISDVELESAHKQRVGLDPGRAEEIFISLSMTLSEYGTHYTSANMISKDGPQTEMWVGVNSKGVVLCYKRDFSRNSVREPHYLFNWPDIKKLAYSKSIFEIVSSDAKYKLKMESNKSFYLFRLAWLHHKFFMKLTNEYTTLQNLTEEFGFTSRETKKGVLYVSPDSKRVELSALRKAASLLSPDRVIFRGKTSTHCLGNGRSESCRLPRVTNPTTSTPPSSLPSTLSLPTHKSSHSCDENVSRTGGVRRRVLMGTRAIYSNSQHDIRFSSHAELGSVSPLPGAYVLNTNIKSEEELNSVVNGKSCESPGGNCGKASVVVTVRVDRGDDGSLGLQVIEGKDGHVYVISTAKGTPAHECRLIHSGDQIQAVNGETVTNTAYSDVLRLIQNSADSVQLVLSRVQHDKTSDHPPSPSELNNLSRLTLLESTGFDLMGVLQKPIEQSYFNAIRYDIATEDADDHIMLSTELPRPLCYL